MMAGNKQISESIREKHKNLAALIEDHNYRYYVLAKPTLSDVDYDTLMSALQELERDYPDLVTPTSPTQRVGGAPIEGFTHVNHVVPMLSIDNTYNENEIRSFNHRILKALNTNSVEYVVELKIDGVSMNLRYEKGGLALAATRGDGMTGDDITANVRTIKSCPLRLKKTCSEAIRSSDDLFAQNISSVPDILDVRGEVYMTNATLQKINEEREVLGQEPFRNPRNTAAGTLKLLDPRAVAKRNLQFFAYDIVSGLPPEISTHKEVLNYLKSLGFPVNINYLHCDSIDMVVDYCNHWNLSRSSLDYEIDGMVIKVNSLEQRKQLGATSKSPRWLIAYKFPAEIARTKLVDIIVQVGKSGALTPVAVMEPIPLCGTVVKRATLHNFEELSRKDLRIGDTIEIQKAGEIIPQILRYVPDFRSSASVPYKAPEKCPACGSTSVKDAEGVYYRCLNSSCPAQVQERLRHYAGKSAMDIEGLGPAIIEQLVTKGLAHNPADLYDLTHPTLLNVDRLAAKSAQKLLESIDASRHQPLNRLLVGLGIRHVGSRIAKTLADGFLNLDLLMTASKSDLLNLEDVGEVVADSIIGYFSIDENRILIDRLKNHGLTVTAAAVPDVNQPKPLYGKSFVVTGTMISGDRHHIHQRIELLGGRVLSSVTKNTDYLVAGENAGSKLAKATSLGIPILSEAMFESLILDLSGEGHE